MICLVVGCAGLHALSSWYVAEVVWEVGCMMEHLRALYLADTVLLGEGYMIMGQRSLVGVCCLKKRNKQYLDQTSCCGTTVVNWRNAQQLHSRENKLRR